MNRDAARKEQILSGIESKIIESSKSVRAVADKFEEVLLNTPMKFKTGEYEVTVEAMGTLSSPDLFMTCTCNYWQYQGPEYHAKRGGYLYGSPRGTAEKPSVKDPNNSHKICKHAYAVLRDFF